MPKKLSNALKPLQVKSLPPGRHTDGGGLQLLVKKSGARSWVFRFMLDGKSRDIGLGAAIGPDTISLAQARDKAIDLRRLVQSGVDPLQERARIDSESEAEAQATHIAGITFKASAEAYIAAHSDSWKNAKHRAQWPSSLENYVYPVIGDLPVADISTEHVMAAIEPIWKTKPETASRVRGRIETVLDAAKARGYRQGENPARWRGHIALMLPARTRLSRGKHPALPYDEVNSFITDLQSRDAMAALALEFTILTAVRSGETIGATWDEVDLSKATWTIPAERMKAGNEHRVPLSNRALAILETTKALGGDFLFAGAKGGKLSNMAMAMMIRRMHEAKNNAGHKGYIDPKQNRIATCHGFRSSFRDWAAESTGYSHEVCEMALAHVIANQAEAAYRRGDLFDKRRKLMDAWATYCASDQRIGATITSIRDLAS
ncbi:tyrosine-type recombinase/integrase [Parasphingorhabdus sp.]|uniref:tyrosine-type recombinase/integrase n=1 Tax=Parasphingorhabdus sp. TaxID=2709688 RepID=UPI003D2E8FBE